MNEDCLKVTAYFGERDRQGAGFLADALLALYERHAVQASILLRGTEGFGIKHRLQTQRLLSLSEDLPIVSVAVDARQRIEGLLPQVLPVMTSGLLTVERARLLTGCAGMESLLTGEHEETKLTIYCGRAERANGRSAAHAIVELLARHGIAAATVFLGVDGMVHGHRRRARFFSRNANVPLLVVSIGATGAIAAILPAIGELLDRPLMTLERVHVLKRDGERLAEPAHVPEEDDAGLSIWQKLTVYADEQVRFGDHQLYVELIRRLRGAGAAGATAIRGIWGYHGDHTPHGDRLLSLARHVPVATIIVERPSEISRLWPLVDEATRTTGLVTSELVPAFRASSPGRVHGGLRLARGRS